MIIGSGMVASALSRITGWDDDIIYASGVSNSGERNSVLYAREIDMIKQHLDALKPGSTFVYFSTTSIFDPNKTLNPYILHKLEIEELLRNCDQNYLIIRLPNLVGKSRNPHTLTNHFADSINHGRKISLSKNAVRHLIDVEDLSSILNEINKLHGKKKLTINVETNHPLTANAILAIMEEAMDKKAIVEEFDEKIKNNTADKVESLDYLWQTNDDYHRKLIRKYYSV